MKIEKVYNGYIVKGTAYTEIYHTLQEVFDSMLLHFEGRAKMFGGDSYGQVIIETTKKTEQEKQADA